MKTNNRLFKSTIGIALLSIMIGYFSAFYFRMDGPVFLRHYFEESINREGNNIHSNPLPLSYITNRNDERVVIGMEFLKYPDILVYASEYYDNSEFPMSDHEVTTLGNAIGPYSIRQVYWEIGDIPEEIALNETIVSEVTILFDDGSELITNIGEIHLNTFNIEDTPLEFSSGSSSSDGTSRTRYFVSENVTVSSFESSLMNRFEDRLHIEIGNEAASEAIGTTLQGGDYLTVSSEITIPEDNLNSFNLFNIQPILTLVNENDEQFHLRILNMNHTRPDYTFSNINKYIEERGAE